MVTVSGLIPDSRLTDLSSGEISRYSRRLLLPEIGVAG
jgi:hypothetical protein